VTDAKNRITAPSIVIINNSNMCGVGLRHRAPLAATASLAYNLSGSRQFNSGWERAHWLARMNWLNMLIRKA